VVKFSGLEEMVVPGGVFYEVVGGLSIFAPTDDALQQEIDIFAAVRINSFTTYPIDDEFQTSTP